MADRQLTAPGPRGIVPLFEPRAPPAHSWTYEAYFMKTSGSRFLPTLFAFTLAMTTMAWAGQEKILRVFTGKLVAFPSSGLIVDPSGNLFGAANGAIYEMSPNSTGGYTFQVIFSFGDNPLVAGNLVRDLSGNLFGSTRVAGANGCGYIFELSPRSSGPWELTTLHHLTCFDGQNAGLTMAMDANGNLFGVTQNGGSLHGGVAYELSPRAGGTWTYQVIHNFIQGESVETGVILDASGNVYGGNNSSVYKLSPNGDGTWTESTAFSFGSASDEVFPLGDLVFDSAGNIFGTTGFGGSHGQGTVFELSPTTGGAWTLFTLYNFAGAGDGSFPGGGVTLDAAGNIYGTTQLSGGPANAGIVYRLSLAAGIWTESVLYRFQGGANGDGAIPQGRLYLHSNTLFGTTNEGGNTGCTGGVGCGTVFAIR
jgi:uncharacterized repeat protein (TIGR03803 family)